MRRLLWPSVLVATFLVGWAAGGVVRQPPTLRPGADPDREVIAKLQSQVETLQARLRTREDLAHRQPGDAGARPGASAPDDRAIAQGLARGSRDQTPGGAPIERTAVTSQGSTSRQAAVTPAQVQAAMDRFYKYMETINDSNNNNRWRMGRELVDDLKAMGPAAGQALMQVLSAANDTDERRAAARLIGQLQVAQAMPMLRDIVEKDNDLLLRRAAAFGLRQLQTPESVPVLERMLAQPEQDRFIRLSAAAGLADQNKPVGVTALTQIFDEAAADGRGREMAFRALSNLKDERSVPFMRNVAAAQVEPGYRLQAIRYLAAQGDEQSLGTLHTIMNSPSEQPSIRDAATAAYAQINRGKR
jgi:HEAT repeat protein